MKLFLAITEDFPEHHGERSSSEEITVENEDRKEEAHTALRALLAKFREETQKENNTSLSDTVIVAWTLEELLPASVPTSNSFEMKDPTPIYHRAFLMFPKHN